MGSLVFEGFVTVHVLHASKSRPSASSKPPPVAARCCLHGRAAIPGRNSGSNACARSLRAAGEPHERQRLRGPRLARAHKNDGRVYCGPAAHTGTAGRVARLGRHSRRVARSGSCARSLHGLKLRRHTHRRRLCVGSRRRPWRIPSGHTVDERAACQRYCRFCGFAHRPLRRPGLTNQILP